MAKVQKRRSVSLNPAMYEKLRRVASIENRSMSSLVEEMIKERTQNLGIDEVRDTKSQATTTPYVQPRQHFTF